MLEISSLQNLTNSFFEECELLFGFLEQYGYSKIYGLSSVDDKGEVIVPYHHKKQKTSNSPIARYECREIAIELVLKTETKCILGRYYYDNTRFSLRALGISFLYKCGYIVLDEYQFFEHTESLREQLGINAKRLCPDLYQTTPWAKAARDKKMQELLEQRGEPFQNITHPKPSDKMVDAIVKSDIAFQQGDYRQVIMLLKPHADELGIVEYSRLQLAMNNLLETAL